MFYKVTELKLNVTYNTNHIKMFDDTGSYLSFDMSNFLLTCLQIYLYLLLLVQACGKSLCKKISTVHIHDS